MWPSTALPTDVQAHDSIMAEDTGDTDRLVQVLVNLLGNAVKFSPKGEPVALSIQAEFASTVRFVVSDHGPGIGPNDLLTIFEPFHQADSSDRRSVAVPASGSRSAGP